jgi:spermidine synthase
MIARILITAALCLLVLILPTGSNAGIPGIGGMRVIYEADSVYHFIVVAEDDRARYLRFDRSFQSGMLLNDPFESPFLYAAYAHLGLIFNPQTKRVLFIGLGGGSIPKRFWRDYPEMSIEVAELDPMVVDVAKRFFQVREDSRLRISVEDGRLFLRRSREKFDIIVLDAYFADSIPFHLTTREFYRLATERLVPGGVLVSNIIGALRGPQSSLFRAIYRTQAAVFPGLYPFPVTLHLYEDVESLRNIILVATNEQGLSRTEIMSRARRIASRVKFPHFLNYAADYYGEPIQQEGVPRLTDDFAPVDTLLPVYRWTPAQGP